MKVDLPPFSGDRLDPEGIPCHDRDSQAFSFPGLPLSLSILHKSGFTVLSSGLALLLAASSCRAQQAAALRNP
ncbi:MAG: hypothetical protein ACLGXA_20825, partial [Acidobacteriota bacterium]